jgi:hypothetical protein
MYKGKADEEEEEKKKLFCPVRGSRGERERETNG